MKSISRHSLSIPYIVSAIAFAIVLIAMSVCVSLCAFADSATASAPVKNIMIDISSESLTSEEGEALGDVFRSSKNEGGMLTLVSEKATIAFDEVAVDRIAQYDVRLRINATTDNIETYSIRNAKLQLDVTMIGASFDDGYAKVLVPIDDEIKSGYEVKVFYLDGEQKVEVEAKYENGYITFETEHFSTFVIAYGETGSSVLDLLSSNFMFAIIIGILLIVLIIVLACIVKSRRNRMIQETMGQEMPFNNAGMPISPVIPQPTPMPVNNAPREQQPSKKDIKKQKQNEKAQREQAQREKAAKEKAEKEQAQWDKIAREQAAKEIIQKEKAQKEIINGKVQPVLVRIISEADAELFETVKSRVQAFEDVETVESQNSYEVYHKKDRLLRLRFKEEGLFAEFNSTAKELKNMPAGIESTSSLIRIKDEDSLERAMRIVENKYYKSLADHSV